MSPPHVVVGVDRIPLFSPLLVKILGYEQCAMKVIFCSGRTPSSLAVDFETIVFYRCQINKFKSPCAKKCSGQGSVAPMMFQFFPTHCLKTKYLFFIRPTKRDHIENMATFSGKSYKPTSDAPIWSTRLML